MNHVEISSTRSIGIVWPQERDLSFWYRPWRYAHASRIGSPQLARLGLSDPDDEVLQRLRYPAWCRLFSLPAHPTTYDGSVWWGIAGADAAVFERANFLAGLVLLLARNRRDAFALMRTAGKEAGRDLRWVMQQANFVPQGMLDLPGWEDVTDPAASGFLSLRLAASMATPVLVERIVLRYPEELVRHAPPMARTGADASCELYLARLWSGAVSRSDGAD